VKTFPLSDSIVLPLAPTIAGIIADYLQSIAQELYVSLSTNCDNANTEFAQDLPWYEIGGRNGVNSSRFAASIRLVPTLQYQYVSPIAHRLTTKLGLTPLEICQQLQPPSPSLAVSTGDRLELSCWHNDSGYIYFQIAPETIATWLNYISDLPIDIQLNGDRSPSSVNIALYAHARCCSLLKLAQTEKLVGITDNWQIVTPEWLLNERSCCENHLTADSTIVFGEPAESRLIQVLMEVLDSIYSYSSQLGGFTQMGMSAAEAGVGSTGKIIRQNLPNWTKLTIDLAESWLEFYRYCRIFGDLHRQNPRLAIARCELTATSRRYLQVLLEHYLGVELINN
jgi:hypothetical protein